MMNWIVPMAGLGTRTKELGMFKPFIPVNNYTIIEWLLLSLSVHFKPEDNITFITTKDFEGEFAVAENLRNSLLKCGVLLPWELIQADDTPQGPAASVYLTKDRLKNSPGPVTIVNVDQYIHFDIHPIIYSEKSGFLPVYAEFGSKSSYVSIKEGLVSEVVEKNNISNIASAGVYGVDSVDTLLWMLERLFKEAATFNNEFYVGPAFNYLISENKPVYPTRTLVKFDLGNIKGIGEFKNRLMYNSSTLGRSPYSVF